MLHRPGLENSEYTLVLGSTPTSHAAAAKAESIKSVVFKRFSPLLEQIARIIPATPARCKPAKSHDINGITY